MIQRRQGDGGARQLAGGDLAAASAQAGSSPGAIDLREFVLMFSGRWRMMMLVMALVVGLGVLYTMTRPPLYEASAKIVVASSRGGATISDKNDAPFLADLQALKSGRSVNTQVEIMSSPDLLVEAFLELPSSLRARGFRSSSLPRWASRITAKKDTDIVIVTARAYAPEAAAKLANSIADVHFRRDLDQSNQATRRMRVYAENELILAKRKLSDAHAELARFKERTGLFSPDDQLARTADRLSQLSSDLESARAEVASTEMAITSLESQLAREKQDVVASTTVTGNPQFNSIVQRIDSLTSERNALLQEYTPDSSEVRAMDDRIRQEEERLRKVAETVVGSEVNTRNPVRDTLLSQYISNVAGLAAARARVRSLETDLKSGKASARSLPDRERGLAERVQRVALLKERYETLSRNYYDLLLSEQVTVPSGMLVSTARAPKASASPDVKAGIVFFGLIGIVAAMLVAIISERVDTRLYHEAAVENISGVSMLSAVPQMRGRAHLQLGEVENGPLLESFRILRNNITFLRTDPNMKTLAITSPGRGEGKSTTTFNLAVAMSMEGKRVLLVDGDMRRPSLHRLCQVQCKPGLAEVILGEAKPEDAIVHAGTQNLDCLPAGRPCQNCPEMLNSSASRELFSKLAEQYDTVLIDSPPAVGLSDVQVISTIADGVLLVVSMHQSVRRQLDMTMRALTLSGAPIIGLVLNRIDSRSRSYGYYDYETDRSEETDTPGDSDE